MGRDAFGPALAADVAVPDTAEGSVGQDHLKGVDPHPAAFDAGGKGMRGCQAAGKGIGDTALHGAGRLPVPWQKGRHLSGGRVDERFGLALVTRALCPVDAKR